MKNRIREIREQKGLTQASLADAAGTSQQQIQRIESGDQAVKLLLATQVAGALGVDLTTLFPETKEMFTDAAGRGKKKPEDFVDDEEAMQAFDDAGIDMEETFWYIKFRTRSGLDRVHNVSSADANRLRRAVHEVAPYAPFFSFSSGDRTIVLNLLEVSFIHELYQGYESSGWNEDPHPEGDVVVYLSGSKEALEFSMEPDEHVTKDFEMLLGGLELDVQPEEFVSFDDADGETVFLRAVDIVLLDVATWTTDVSVYPEV